MPVLKLLVKPDNTFLNQIIYEGILALIYYNRDKASTSIDEVSLPHNALRKLFETIKNDEKLVEHISQIKIEFIGNDKKKKYRIRERILASFGLEVTDTTNIDTYGDLIRVLIDNISNIPDLKDSTLIYRIRQGRLFVGDSTEDVTAPQLFKIDRYTGYTSLDKDTTYKQYTLKSPPPWINIGIVGIMSAYIANFGNTHYFLFFSPDEIIEILARSDPEYIYNIFSVKNMVLERLREILKAYIPEEVVVLSILLDINLISEISKYEIDYLSLQIYRVLEEKKNYTYKIYNTISLTIYSRPYYLVLLEQYTRKPEKIIETLSKAFSGRGIIIQTLRSLSYDNAYPEAGHVLSAAHELYRLIAFGDPSGLHGFIRYLETACKVLESKDDADSKSRLKQYRVILSEISRSL